MKRLYIFVRSFLLKITDLITFGRGTLVTIQGMKLRLPYRYGKYYPPLYEDFNFNFLRSITLSDGICIDIGAHLGIYSFWLAKSRNKEVLAFEPTPFVYEELNELVRLNHASQKIKIFKTAVSGRCGTSLFQVYNGRSFSADPLRYAEANSLQKFRHASDPSNAVIEVPCTTIDRIREESNQEVCLIKIDAEGSEAEILSGGLNTFTRDRPYAIVSIHCFMYDDPHGTLTRIFEFFENLKYSVYSGNKKLSKPSFLELKDEEIFDIQVEPSDPH